MFQGIQLLIYIKRNGITMLFSKLIVELQVSPKDSFREELSLQEAIKKVWIVI